MKRTKNLIVITIAIFSLCSVILCVLLRNPISYSDTERRPLAQFSGFSLKNFISGKFAKDFEVFTLDQFPLRDEFRSLKAYTHFYGLGQKDNNGLYFYEDYIAKMEYPLHVDSVKRATGILNTCSFAFSFLSHHLSYYYFRALRKRCFLFAKIFGLKF